MFANGYLEARPSRILAWTTGAVGDTLLSFPALQALRDLAPDATITAIGRPDCLDLAVDLGLVDHVDDADGPFAAAFFDVDRLKEMPAFDLAVVWSSASNLIKRNMLEAGAQFVIGAAPRGAESIHQSVYLLSCLEPLGIMPACTTLRWSPEARADGDGKGGSALVERRILIHAGTGARWKRWPLTRFLTLAAEYRAAGYRVMWSFGEADADIRDALAADPSNAETLPRLPLRELAAVIARCSLVVSGDTGIAHLGALCGTPTLTIFGPTDAKRWRPLGPMARVLGATNACGGAWLPAMSSIGGAPQPSLRRCPSTADDVCSCLCAVEPRAVFDRSFSLLTPLRS